MAQIEESSDASAQLKRSLRTRQPVTYKNNVSHRMDAASRGSCIFSRRHASDAAVGALRVTPHIDP